MPCGDVSDGGEPGTRFDGVLTHPYSGVWHSSPETARPGSVLGPVPHGQTDTATTGRPADIQLTPEDITVSVSIKPLEDRILVQTLEAEQTTASGLVIPDTAKEKPQEGKVLAVGPGRFDEDGDKRIPLDIKVGDVVIYSKYGGTEVKYNN